MQATIPDSTPQMSALDLSLWAELIRQRCGLSFAESRPAALARSLSRRMRERNLASYHAYYQLLAQDGEEAEWVELQDLLLNNETSFFRDRDAFEALRLEILPRLMAARREQSPRVIRMWSVGCSTGQEAYSLVMCFLRLAEAKDWQVHVIGSDLSRQALERARRGRYRAFEIQRLEPRYRNRFLRPVATERGECHEIVSEVRGVVEFTALNLTDPSPWTLTGRDVIYCQNVLLYFRPPDRTAILVRLVECLEPGGFLVLSPSEAMGLSLPGTARMPFGAAIYQRIP